MSVPTRPSDVVDWWARALTRSGAGRKARTEAWRLLLVRDAAGLAVHARQGATMRRLGVIDPAHLPKPGGEGGRVLAEAMRLRSPARATVLRLAPEEVMQTAVTLPAGVRDVLDRVIRNQLERLTPFTTDQALVAYTVAATEPAPGQIGVDLWVTGRERVEGLLRLLSEAGIDVGRVDSGTGTDSGPGYNLISRDDEERRRRERRWAGGIKAVAVLALLMAAAAGGTWGYLHTQREAQRAAIAARLAEASALANPQDAESRRQRQAVVDARRNAQPMVVMLEALSRALPDTAYLERLEARDGGVTISGKAEDVPALIGPLEAVGAFDQVQFAAATTRREGESIDTFSISARMKPGAILGGGR
jgi:general secretion pathway protein L